MISTEQTALFDETQPLATAPCRRRNSVQNKLDPLDRRVHDWYRFVLSYPPHLVREYLTRFGVSRGHTVLDPFSGTGTTVVECKKRGVDAIGVEANPMAWLASSVKTDWEIDPALLFAHAHGVAGEVRTRLASDGFRGLSTQALPPAVLASLLKLAPEQEKLLLANSISPLPLHRCLRLLEVLNERRDERFYRHEILALAKGLVTDLGNLHFGPEVGVGPPKVDAPVVSCWLKNVEQICSDVAVVHGRPAARTVVHYADSRTIRSVLQPQSVDAVITSPPYPNEKDYTRTTRLESVLLGLVKDSADLRALKKGLLRSNTRGVYHTDDDDQWIEHHAEVQRIAEAIESRRLELGKTSGFEKLYSRVTKLYFGGMAKHLADLREILRPGAHLAYVVGDQASYLRVMIRTGQLLADIAVDLGYELEGLDLFRTRLSTATREQLREEVVVLRWPG